MEDFNPRISQIKLTILVYWQLFMFAMVDSLYPWLCSEPAHLCWNCFMVTLTPLMASLRLPVLPHPLSLWYNSMFYAIWLKLLATCKTSSSNWKVDCSTVPWWLDGIFVAFAYFSIEKGDFAYSFHSMMQLYVVHDAVEAIGNITRIGLKMPNGLVPLSFVVLLSGSELLHEFWEAQETKINCD
jgi:hypothetical protein